MLNQLRLLRDVSALALIAVTWRLWFSASDFPAVPFFSFLTDVPRSVDRILSSLLVTSLLVDAAVTALRVARNGNSAAIDRLGRGCDLVFVLSALSLILLNQHCLQPWMYHFLILTPVLRIDARRPDATSDLEQSEKGQSSVSGSNDFSRRSIIWLTASIYVWSAWSKLDASFLHSHGPKFVSAICEATGLSTQFWSDRAWLIAAALLPVGELLVGVALLFLKSRAYGLAASLAMHLLLMVAVGPWGLNHEAGVLLWNGYFIVQNVILFTAERRSSAQSGQPVNDPTVGASSSSWAGKSTSQFGVLAVLIGAILFPAFRAVGCCDTWPAWAVYASSPARVFVQVHDDSVETLPEQMQKFVEQRQLDDGWSWIRIDLWSLAATSTPLYPDDRFQLGVGRFVVQEAEPSEGIRIIHEEEADRLTGERKRKEFQGKTEIIGVAAKFLFNSKPR